MASWQAKFFRTFVRLILRRRRWGGDEQALAGRARLLFGSPKPIQWLKSLGLNVQQVNEQNVRGEWLTIKRQNSDKDKVVFYVHGGGFVSSSAAAHRPIPAALARLTNFRAFSIDYRLAPEHRFPAGLDDVLAGYQWLLKQGISSDKISVAGDSAGGNLVISLILRLREMSLPLPGCAVCFSPWTIMSDDSESRQANGDRDRMFYPENISEFAAAYLSGGADYSNQYAAPVLADFENFPPVLFQVGDDEILVDDSRLIHEKILKAGGASELEIYEGVFHCWQMSAGFMPESDDALQKAATFINRHIPPDN